MIQGNLCRQYFLLKHICRWCDIHWCPFHRYPPPILVYTCTIQSLYHRFEVHSLSLLYCRRKDLCSFYHIYYPNILQTNTKLHVLAKMFHFDIYQVSLIYHWFNKNLLLKSLLKPGFLIIYFFCHIYLLKIFYCRQEFESVEHIHVDVGFSCHLDLLVLFTALISWYWSWHRFCNYILITLPSQVFQYPMYPNEHSQT